MSLDLARRKNHYAFMLSELRYHGAFPVEMLLNPLQSALKRCEEQGSEIGQSKDASPGPDPTTDPDGAYWHEQYYEQQFESLVEQIEDLLGLVFVVLQNLIRKTYTTAVSVERIASMNETKAQTWIDSHSEEFPGTTFTRIRVIWELGNFFKHQDEWPYDWKTVTNTRTVDAIRAAGVEPNSTGNFRIAAKKLGMVSFADVDLLLSQVMKWRDSIRTHFVNKYGIGLEAVV